MKIGRTSAALSAVLIGITAGACGAAGDLGRGFADPPDSAKPWAYWWWLDSNVSKLGITADLEAMKKQGIGDANLPKEKWRTSTNVTKFKANSPLLESGLLGPVTLQSASGAAVPISRD